MIHHATNDQWEVLLSCGPISPPYCGKKVVRMMMTAVHVIVMTKNLSGCFSAELGHCCQGQ